MAGLCSASSPRAQPAILCTSAHPLYATLAHPTPLRRDDSKIGAEAARWHPSCLELSCKAMPYGLDSPRRGRVPGWADGNDAVPSGEERSQAWATRNRLVVKANRRDNRLRWTAWGEPRHHEGEGLSRSAQAVKRVTFEDPPQTRLNPTFPSAPILMTVELNHICSVVRVDGVMVVEGTQ